MFILERDLKVYLGVLKLPVLPWILVSEASCYLEIPDLTVYPTGDVQTPDVVIASDVAKELSVKHGLNEVTLKELTMFDKRSLELILHGLKGNKPSTVLNAIELLKRQGTITISDQNFDKMLSYLGKGLLLNEDAIKALQENRAFSAQGGAIKTEEIDKTIMEIVAQRPDLVKEYKSNGKAFNFIVGMVLKKHKVNPKYISERLAEILKDKA